MERGLRIFLTAVEIGSGEISKEENVDRRQKRAKVAFWQIPAFN